MDGKHGLALGEHAKPKWGHYHVINPVWDKPRPFKGPRQGPLLWDHCLQCGVLTP